jgi:hypothetical protein
MVKGKHLQREGNSSHTLVAEVHNVDTYRWRLAFHFPLTPLLGIHLSMHRAQTIFFVRSRLVAQYGQLPPGSGNELVLHRPGMTDRLALFGHGWLEASISDSTRLKFHMIVYDLQLTFVSLILVK